MFITLKENETMKDLVGRLAESFEMVYGIAPVAYWYENLNPNGRIRDIHFSKRMREMLGYGSEEEFPDELSTLMTFTHPDDVHLMLDDAIRAGTGEIEKYDVQYRIRKADGSYMWCNATGELVKDCRGTTVGMYGAFIDVTEEVKLQQKQQEQQRSGEMISGFIREYEVALLVDLRDGQYTVLQGKPEIDAFLPRRGDFISALLKYLDTAAHPRDRERAEKASLSLDFLRDFVPVGESRSIEFRSGTSGDYVWYRGTFSRINGNEIVAGFRDCNDEVLTRTTNEKLMDEYDAIYFVNLDKGRILPARSSRVSAAGVLSGPSDYTPTVLRFAKTVAPKYRKDWQNFADPEYMKRYIANDDRREYVYEIPGIEKSMRRFTVDVIERDTSGTAVSVLFSFMGIDDSRAEAIRLHREMAEQKEQLEIALEKANEEALRSTLIYQISGSSQWAYKISAEDDSLTVQYADSFIDHLEVALSEGPMDWIANVHPDDRERTLAAFTAAVRDHSGATPYNETFRTLDTDGKYRWVKSVGRVLRHSDGSGEFFGMATDITEQMEEQEKRIAEQNEIERLRSREQELMHAEFRAAAVAYLTENEGKIESYLNFFAGRLRELVHCDQVIYRNIDGDEFVNNAPELGPDFALSPEVCRNCAHYDILSPVYADGIVEMPDNGKGINGIYVHEACPVKSSLTRIVYLDGEVYGYLTIHYISNFHEFSDYERRTLEEFTNLLSISLSRYEAKQRSDELVSVRRRMNMIYSLSDEYDPIIVVDPESGEYDWYESKASEVEALTSMTVHGDDLYKNIGIDGASIIHEDDREQFKAFYSRENMLRIARTGETQETENRWQVGPDGGYCWKYNKAVRLVDESGKVFVAVGVIDTTETKEKEAEYLAQRIRTEEQNAFTNYFLEPYMSAYYIGFDDLSCRIYKRTTDLEKEYPIISDYLDSLSEYIRKEVHPEEREEFLTLIQPAKMKEILSAQKEFKYIFRTGEEGETRYIKFQVIRGADENHAAFGFMDVTQDVMEQQEAERLKSAAVQLEHEQLRAEVLNFMVDHDDDPIDLLKLFAERIRVLINCDQVIYRDLEETRIMVNSPEIEETWSVPIEYCRQCQHFDAHHPMYAGGYTEMENCQEGWQGIPVYHDCPIKSSLTRIVYCDGEIAGYLAIHYVQNYHHFTDIERRTLEEFTRILSMSLSRYAARLESRDKKRFDILHEIINSGQWTFYVNADDEITAAEFSEGLKRIINNDITGEPMSWLNSVHPDERESVSTAFFAAIADHSGNTPYDTVFRMADKDGNYHSFHSAGRIIRDSDGNGEFFGIHIDISEQIETEKQQQRQLEEALAMAQSASRAKTTFLNNMSHDIRTPMNAIIGYTGLAASHIDNKEQVQDYLSKISQSSDHLLSLINDVLDMSRIESGKMNLDEKEENLSVILHTLRDIVQADIHSKRLDFFVDAVDVNDEDIVCDKLRLNQVLLNILSNSIKYTPAGGTVTMRVRETTVKPNGYAEYEFCIKDNGMGMDGDFLKTIFDPFTRVRSSTVSGIQGTGLGMAITKNIVDMMGGKIDIQSLPGKGTEVVVTFDFLLQSAPRKPEEIPELRGVRALVADDDSTTCLSICNMLEDIGMRDEWCTSGKEAVIRAEAAHQKGDSFMVYIIDWIMPDMNGIETTRRIRKVIGDDAPIIILTAYDWSDIEEEAREAGVTAFVSKPLFPSDLNRVLNTCLGKEERPEKKIAADYDFRGKKVLLVEDNALNREIAIELLEEEGFAVDVAEDGDIAVNIMDGPGADGYDVILMDVQMPRMDGYEATRQIRALPSLKRHIPIIAMTANAFEEDRRAAIAAGMDEHIAKPIDFEKLKEVLASFL